MADKPKPEAPASIQGGEQNNKPKPWVAILAVIMLVVGIVHMVYGILTKEPPKKKKQGH